MELGHQLVEGAVTFGDQALAPLLQAMQAGIHGGVTVLDDRERFGNRLDIAAAHQAADELQMATEGLILLRLEFATQLDSFCKLFIQRDFFQLAVAEGDDLFPHFLQCFGIALELALAGAPVFELVVVLILTHRSLDSCHSRLADMLPASPAGRRGLICLPPFPSFIQM